MDLIHNHDGAYGIDDATHEIVLNEPCLKITIDSGLLRGELSSEDIFQGFLAPVEFEWERMRHYTSD